MSSNGLPVSAGRYLEATAAQAMRKTSASRLSSAVGAKSTWRGRNNVSPLTPPSSSVSVTVMGAPVSRRASASRRARSGSTLTRRSSSRVDGPETRSRLAPPHANEQRLVPRHVSARLAEGAIRPIRDTRFGSDDSRRRTARHRCGENRPNRDTRFVRVGACASRPLQKLMSTRSCSARAVATSSVNGCTRAAPHATRGGSPADINRAAITNRRVDTVSARASESCPRTFVAHATSRFACFTSSTSSAEHLDLDVLRRVAELQRDEALPRRGLESPEAAPVACVYLVHREGSVHTSMLSLDQPMEAFLAAVPRRQRARSPEAVTDATGRLNSTRRRAMASLSASHRRRARGPYWVHTSRSPAASSPCR